MNQPSTTAGTWAPDWVGLGSACLPALITICGPDTYRADALQIARLVVESYQRQTAAAGLVLVRATVLRVLLDHFTGYGDAYAEACKAQLDAAMPAPTPEGDAG